jgi:uncharacterized protein YecE (DUF72 family)
VSVHIGTSGWMYDGWRDILYRGLSRPKWLSHASRTFTGLEVNATFYRQQSEDTFRRWAADSPRGFRFAIKGHRFITHYRRLREVGESIQRLRRPALGLGRKLDAVVWQLPADFRCDMERLASFVAELENWPEARHALELRHRSWFTPAVAELLATARVAVCLSDAPDFPMWRAITTDLVYIRLHGHVRKYASRYHGLHLRRWAADIRRWRDEGRTVHCYFDNDAEGAAPRDALRLIELVGAEPAVTMTPWQATARS